MEAILDFRSECFLLVNPMLSVKTIGLSFQEKKQKIYFQDGGHLGLPIETIFAIFDLKVTLMLPTKFQVNWHFVSGEEEKK